MSNEQLNVDVQEVFRHAIDIGYYNTGSNYNNTGSNYSFRHMCNSLEYMSLSSISEISSKTASECERAIKSLIGDSSTLQVYLWYTYHIDATQEEKASIYYNWNDRYKIIEKLKQEKSKCL